MNPRYRLVSDFDEIIREPLLFENLRRLWSQQGWQTEAVEGRVRSNKAWELTLHRSLHFVSVWNENLLIGFGRCTYDIVTTTVYDMVVDDCYRRQGIGQWIMGELVRAALAHDQSTTISLERWEGYPDNEAFYGNLGFAENRAGMKLGSLAARALLKRLVDEGLFSQLMDD